MQLFIVNGRIVASHEDHQDIAPSAYNQYDEDGALTGTAHVMHVPDGTEFQHHAAPPELTAERLEKTKTLAKRRVVALLNELDDSIADLVPRAERDGWGTKSLYAEAYVAGTATARQLAMLQKEADRTDESLADLVDHIIDRATRYEPISGDIAGVRRNCHKQIDLANSIEAIEQAVETARTEAEGIYQTAMAAQGS